MKTYDVHHALIEDISQGGVWIYDPDLDAELHGRRCIVRIKAEASRKSVYCEALAIDANDETFYNHARANRGIPEPVRLRENPTILMNAWFRRKLRIRDGRNELHVAICKSPWCGICACFHHPQVVVRLATWLGFIGVALGVLGVVLAVIPLFKA